METAWARNNLFRLRDCDVPGRPETAGRRFRVVVRTLRYGPITGRPTTDKHNVISDVTIDSARPAKLPISSF